MLNRLKSIIGSGGLHGRIWKGGIASVCVKVTGLVFSLSLAVVLARQLGPDGYGVFSYVIALATLISIPAQLGLPVLVVRETARAHVSEQWGLLRGVWLWASWVVLGASIVAGLVAIWVLTAGNINVSAEQQLTALWGICLIPLLALGNLRGAALRGLRHIVQGQLPEVILRPALLLSFLLVFAFWFPQIELNSATAMMLNVVAAGGAFFVGAIMLWRARPEGVRQVPSPQYRASAWAKAMMPLAFVAGAQVINQKTDILMLGMLGNAEQVGIYRVSAQGATLVSFGATAIGMAIVPYYARLFAQSDFRGLQTVATLGARLMLGLAAPVAVILLVWGRELIFYVFGSDYALSYWPMIVMCVANVLSAGFGSVGPLLNMTGHERFTARGVGVAAICNVVLNAVLIPDHGVVGAALATSFTLLIWNLMLWRKARVLLRIDSSFLGLKPF